MSERNTVIRSMHDLGLAAWFGGSLMGAVGLNGAAAAAKLPQERLRLSSIGWAKWAPVQLAALGAHAVGGLGLIYANKGRLAGQSEARSNTNVKAVLTIAAAGTTLYSAIVGAKMAKHQDEGAAGTTEPGAGSSKELAAAQKKQKALQWIIPAMTSVLVVLAAQQGEQQRPVAGWIDRIKH
ncbi:hypothetical protein [Clavibacter sp. CFBP 8614]|uniref:hypothetical protein n=1 Tax=unclassified Clavibacter TaxID=2626594 RepID=UPI0040427769